ncbi:MAG: SRPBCC domain-containing protein [Weeksellaceae bacterium]|nr:SRPBCC domain-containing protein [Weeksellaceae bacterium]
MHADTVFNKDENSASVFVMKVFPADVTTVWNYFSKEELIDRWWAPKPWRCETAKLDFNEGGVWSYAMVGPEGQRQYAGAKYNEIMFHRSIAWSDYFSDEHGNPNTDKPVVDWLIGFTGVEEGTKLTVNLHFRSARDMTELLDMGFEEGFKMALNNLKDILGKS